MATWDSYTQKSTPADNDTLMIKDTSGGANKRTPFSGVWNWIVSKLASAVISQLETTNKSIIPAINELNSKSYLLQGGTAIPSSSDMDNYTTPGNYYCESNGTAQSLSNCPFTYAFILKVEYSRGNGYVCQTYTEHHTGRKAYRWYNTGSTGWSQYVYFSNDDTLFTPQDVVITDGDYGHVNGIFKRIGSILVFSFYISLTKEYSASYDTIFTFDSIRAVGRYDFASYSGYTDDLPVIDLYFPADGDNASFNIGSASTITAGKTIFCSGTMIVTDK